MSLDKFQMSSELVYELYKNSLVALDTAQILPESLKSGKPAFLGNNSQQVLILVECSTALHLDEQELQLLIGILTACKLTLNDVAVFNIYGHQAIDNTFLMLHFQPKQIISFGVQKTAALTVPQHNFIPENNNGIQWISSPSLHTINGDVQMKKSLWNGLKTIFGL